jgi:hypothetical protein
MESWQPKECRIRKRSRKRPGLGIDHTPPPKAEVKERVQLHIYSPLGLHGIFNGYFVREKYHTGP